MTDHERILKAIRRTEALPTIPAVALDVLRMSGDPRTSIEKLAHAIEKDPALAAKTLCFANSSFYGSSRPIVSLSQALVRIGIRGAKMLALSFSLLGACDRMGPCGFDFRAFWYRSLTASVTARRIAMRSVRHLADEAFVATLLADVGCPILAKAFPREYHLLEKSVNVGQRRLVEVEERLLGIGHPPVSQQALQAWRLPAELCQAVGAHHHLEQLDRDNPAFTVAAIITTASDLTDAIIRGATAERAEQLAAAFQEYFSFDARHVEALLGDLGLEVQRVGQMLDVPVPSEEETQAAARNALLLLALAEPQAARAAASPDAGPPSAKGSP